MTTETETDSGTSPGPGPNSGTAAKPARPDLTEILGRAHKGDEGCLPVLRALLDSGEGGARLVDLYGSPAVWMESKLVDQSSGRNLAMKEAMRRKLDGLRSGLAGPSPTPLEKLLADRAALCWLAVHTYEARYAGAGDLSIRQADYAQRRIDRAHARFLSAVRTLAQVRKLALPTLQVNIARNQVNLAGGGEGT